MSFAVYIGAGIDTRPIFTRKDITTFIYVDSQPYTQYGITAEYDTYNYTFIDELIYEMGCVGFYIDFQTIDTNKCYWLRPNKLANPARSEPVCLEFVNEMSGRKVLYYINTIFPNVSLELLEYLKQSHTLIIAGFIPHKSILEMLKPTSLIELILYEGTVYAKDDDEADCITNYIHEVGFEKARIGKCIVYHKEYIGQEFPNLQEAGKDSLFRFNAGRQ